MDASSLRLIPLGKVGRPHGFRGSVVVHTDSGAESSLASLSRLFIGKTAEVSSPYVLREASWMPRGWKVTLAEVQTEDAAKGLTGLLVFVPRQELPTAAPGEYYLADLVGASLFCCDSNKVVGRFLGLEARQASGASVDRWWFEIDGRQVVIPATRRYIDSVDAGSRTIRVRNLGECL